jgi:putative transposase
LFEGRFQTKWVDRDEYLLHLTRYIHLNPVKAGLVERPEDWAFSSYQDYVGLRRGTLPRSTEVLAQVGGTAAYRQFVTVMAEPQVSIQHLLLD